MSSEKSLQDKVIEYLKSKDIYTINVYGAGYTAKGAPDLIASIKGRFVAFELKVGTNTMEPAQIIHSKRIKRSGGLHFTPYTFNEAKTIIDKLLATGG